MPTNEFLPFASGTDPNVLPQADYAALSARTGGFVAGTAESEQLNKVWRQGSNMASAWGGVLGLAGLDALDDGDVDALRDNLKSAISGTFSKATNGYVKLPSGIILQWGTATVPTASGSSSSTVAITFPTTFPTACRAFVATPTRGANASNGYVPTTGVYSLTASGCTLGIDTLTGSSTPLIGVTQTVPCVWFAIGY